MIFSDGVQSTIGNTPLVDLSRFCKQEHLAVRILAKAEYMNPTGSVKDRAALYMLNAAIQEGKLKPGGTIIEPTSGNTGIALAALAVPLGYRVLLTMPETMSLERRKLLRSYGAEPIITDGDKGMDGAIQKAEELLREIPDSYMPRQFQNLNNVRAHYETTGPEIISDLGQSLDCFVCGVGTGGTITGTSRYLKEFNPSVTVIAVEPLYSAVLSGGMPGPHKLQGIGAGFIPQLLDKTVYNEIIPVDNEDAIRYARLLAVTEGLVTGYSSGAALYAAAKWAKRHENADKTIVVLIPDNGSRYLSTDLYT